MFPTVAGPVKPKPGKLDLYWFCSDRRKHKPGSGRDWMKDPWQVTGKKLG